VRLVGLVHSAAGTLIWRLIGKAGKYNGFAPWAVSAGSDLAGAAGWQGLNPDLTLSDVRIDDADGRPALAFSRVEVILDWSSLLHRHDAAGQHSH